MLLTFILSIVAVGPSSVVQPHWVTEVAGHLPSGGYASTRRCHSGQMPLKVSGSPTRRSGYTGSTSVPHPSSSLISGTETLPDYTKIGTTRITPIT